MANENSRRAPLGIILFAIIVLLLSILFRFFFPQQAVPLKPFSIAWYLLEGILLFIYLFPAIVLSGLVVPFGFSPPMEGERIRFSPAFLSSMTKPLLTAITAAAVYALFTLLIQPLVMDARKDLALRGYLFTVAKERSLMESEKGNWLEAGYHLAVCERIWPRSPETEKLRDAVGLGMEELRLSGGENELIRMMEASSLQDKFRLPGYQYTALTASEALSLAKEALAQDQAFDAHWLASFALRLAKEGSSDASEATLVATQAWNAISDLGPDQRERRAFNLYQRKREGYNALISEDWIRSYYIFKELQGILPQDPDVRKYLAIAERGTASIAFFVDEISLYLGEVLTDAVVSLPIVDGSGKRSGTILVNGVSLAVFNDVSYATELVIRAFDSRGILLYSLKTPYAKILPFTMDSIQTDGLGSDGVPKTLILLNALDRIDQERQWRPEWTKLSRKGADASQFILDIPYENFLLALRARKGPETLSVGELQRVAKYLESYGFLPQVHQVELIKRFFDPLNLLILCVLILTLGWRLRSKRGLGIISFIMLPILPVVFNVVVQTSRYVVEIIAFQLILLWPPVSALFIIFGAGTLLFFFTLVLLTGQRG